MRRTCTGSSSAELRSQIRHCRLTDRIAAEPATHGHDPADTLVNLDLVRSALATLSARDQEVLRLTEWDELTATEGAQVLGCSTPTFTVRLHRARRRFAAALHGSIRPSTGPAAVPTELDVSQP